MTTDKKIIETPEDRGGSNKRECYIVTITNEETGEVVKEIIADCVAMVAHGRNSESMNMFVRTGCEAEILLAASITIERLAKQFKDLIFKNVAANVEEELEDDND